MPRDRKYREREEEVAAKGPTVDLNTVHLEWDACQGLRDRLRDAKCLLNTDAKKEESNNACIKNAELLKPLLLRMGSLPKKPLPTVEDLREELQKLLLMHKFTEPCSHGRAHKCQSCLGNHQNKDSGKAGVPL